MRPRREAARSCARRGRSPADLQRAALRATAGAQEHGHIHLDRLEPGLPELLCEHGRGVGHDHMMSVRRDVQAQDTRVGFAGHDGVRKQAPKNGPAVGRERRREVGNRVVVQDGQSSVEVVEARVNQLQAHHLPASERRLLGVGRRVRPMRERREYP